MTVLDAPKLLTLDEVAQTLRLSRRTIERMVAADLLPALRVGQRAVRIDADEFEEWLYGDPPETGGVRGSARPSSLTERHAPENVEPAVEASALARDNE